MIKIEKNKRTGIFLIIVLSFVSFSNTLKNGFVYDDEFFVTTNEAIRSLKNTPLFFTDAGTAVKGSNFEGDVYRPVSTLSYALDYFFWKLNPSGYHLTNLFFHSLNGILLFFLLNLILKNNPASLVASLFFVVHPIQTDAVSWISGRGNVLFLFFYLLSFYLFCHSRISHLYYFSSIFCFALSVLAKEMAVTLPLILLLYVVYFPHVEQIHTKNDSKKKNKNDGIWYLAPYFVIDILFVLARSAVLGKVSQRAYWGDGLYETGLSMSRVFVSYIKLLFYPVKLCADYVYPVATSITEPTVILSLFFLGVLLVAVFYFYGKSKIVSFSIAWFFITMLPVSNIIPLKILLAERFLYLPSIGFCILLAYLIVNNKTRLKTFQVVIVIFVLGFYGTRTYLRNFDWKDGFTFWSGVVKCSPVNAKAHNNLGTCFKEKGLFDAAETEFRTSIELKPGYITPHFNLAGVYIEEKKYEESLVELRKVLEINPEYPNARKHYDEVFNYIKRRGI